MANLNENMKRLRLEKGMTLTDVGEKIGVRNATVQRADCRRMSNAPTSVFAALCPP